MSLLLQNIRLPMDDTELSLDCAIEGKITAIFGPTGSGKTSMMEIIAGIRRPRTGKAVLSNRVLLDIEKGIFLPARQRNTGYVPQDLALFPHMNVFQNIEYGRKMSGKSRRDLKMVIKILEIGSLLSRKPHTLSGGEKQRVAFARALFAEPDILLLDEPLSSLDDMLKQRIIPYILRMRDEAQIPIVYVTHSSEEVMRLCDQVIILQAGKVVAQGIPTDLFIRSDRAVYLPKDL